ncbi:MAG: hypothetical protein JWQ24_638 [Tardiphaga sp.]|nr:hypothetical protein [Tardiphaga sp.]
MSCLYVAAGEVSGTLVKKAAKLIAATGSPDRAAGVEVI